MKSDTSPTLSVAINAQLVSFAQSYRNAGVSRFTYALLEGLSQGDADQHYTVFINAREAAAAAASHISASPRMRLTPARWPTASPARRILWEQLALPSALRRLRADLFHSTVNILPERLPCPSVVTIHDLAFIRYPQYFRPERRIYQRAFAARSVRRATLTVAVSASARNDLIELFHAPPERIRVIHPAIDADFQPVDDPAALAAFRARHALPERYLLYLGTLEPRKNLLTLVDAYAQLRAADPDAPPLILAGAKGWYYQALFERVQTLGLDRAITFAGYISREEQPMWYASAALFIYPSLYEGFGLPIAEALACGTPTITSDVSGMPEAGGPVATLCPPNDVTALAHAMRVVLADPQSRPRARDTGPRWASQFTAARMAAEYAAVYRDAVASAAQVAARSSGMRKD